MPASRTPLPLYAVLDWVLVRDRPRLPWRSVWLVLPYPLVWLVVVLLRGQNDGWVPYGFLLPSRGLGPLVLTSLGLLAMLLTSATAVWALSRIVLPRRRGVGAPR
ncbi:Pr6Pr family membrane protein [Microbacterium marinum]|uniref:Pr6Pr family membrane protein n=1 Tax=Microbacterium marinum TaxID=421115 RepID=UPI003851409B